MSTQAEQTSIRTQIVVDVPIERAFRVFVQDFARIKPREHNILGVEIAETAERTRVELEHRNLDRHGDGWPAARDTVGGDGGWSLYLQRYGDLLDAER
jgi:hypothetical protein